MAAFNKFNVFAKDILAGVHSFDGGHTFRLMLSSGAPVASDTILANISGQMPASGGFPAGGPGLGVTLTLSGAIAKVTIADEQIEATGTIGPFRYGIIYNDTATSPSGANPLVGWFDHGASITLNVGETFTADFDATAGAFTLA